MTFSPDLESKFSRLLARYPPGRERSAVVPMLLFAQDELGSVTAELVDEVARRCTEVESGARNVEHILANTLLPEMSRELLARMARGESMSEVRVSMGEQGFDHLLLAIFFQD